MKKIIVLFLLFLTSCTTMSVVDDDFYTRYEIEKTKINLYSVSFDELYDNFEKNNMDGLVLVVKDSCEHCKEFMKEFVELTESVKKCKTIYVLESSNLSNDEKKKLYEDYFLTSVPSILEFKNGSLNSLNVGIPKKDEFINILKK